MWTGAHPVRIAESLASALFTTLNPAVVYVAFNERGTSPGGMVAQIDRYQTSVEAAKEIGPAIVDWARSHDPEEALYIPAPIGAGTLAVFTRVLGLGGEFGVIAAGFRGESSDASFCSLILGVAATQATVAIRNTHLLHSLRESEERLRHANRFKDELMGMISHEFRTPLTTITGNIDMLSRRFEDLPTSVVEESFDEIRRGSERLKRLIQNMLVIARGDVAGDVKLEPVLLQRIVPKLLMDQSHHGSLRPIRVHFADDLPPVLADHGALDQILENLVTNALKYGEPGTPIDISGRLRDGFVDVCVADSGPELEASEVERFTEAFFRSDQTRTRASGVGLGLAVCALLAGIFGGKLRAEPRSGGGLLVTLAVPVVAE